MQNPLLKVLTLLREVPSNYFGLALLLAHFLLALRLAKCANVRNADIKLMVGLHSYVA